MTTDTQEGWVAEVEEKMFSKNFIVQEYTYTGKMPITQAAPKCISI